MKRRTPRTSRTVKPRRSRRSAKKTGVRRHNATSRSDREVYARERALAVLAALRRDGKVALTSAAKAEGVDPRTVQRYVGSALRQTRAGGPYRPTASDRLVRRLQIATSQGMAPVTVRSSRTASRIADYANATRVFANTGERSALAQFEGQSFRAGGVTYHFITDPVLLRRLVDADALKIDGLYRSIQGPRG
jgi:hypothetical protein